MNSFKHAAIEILKKVGKPLHYTEITRIAKESGLKTKGPKPEGQMSSVITSDIKNKKEKSDFIRIPNSHGMYALNPNKKEIKVVKEKQTEDDKKSGYVYVLTNPAMPQVVKIGKTKRGDIKKRLKELFNTSVPVPFECEHASKVDDYNAVENALHIAFDPYRAHPSSSKREFFTMRPEQAIAILLLLEKENVTPEIKREISENIPKKDRDAGKKMKQLRTPNINFSKMGIKIGKTLIFDGNENRTEAKVISDKKVSYNGVEYSLSDLTKKLLQLDYGVRPTPYWTYEGEQLIEIYNKTFPV